jgi:hypothetical protein
MPRDFLNVIWTPVDSPSPRGHVSNPEESKAILNRATTVAFVLACFARVLHAWSYGPDSPTGSVVPWAVGLGTFTIMLVLGYVHYRGRGPMN